MRDALRCDTARCCGAGLGSTSRGVRMHVRGNRYDLFFWRDTSRGGVSAMMALTKQSIRFVFLA